MKQHTRFPRVWILTIIACSLPVWVAGGPAASAQAPAPTNISIDLADGLSPWEAVRLALQQNIGLLALRKAHEAAASGVSTAKALPDPELRMGMTNLDDYWKSPGTGDYRLAVRWSPPRPGERSLKAELAVGKTAEIEGEIAGAEQRLAADVLFLHMKILFLDQQIAQAEASIKLREEMVGFLQSQVKEEVKSLFDQNVAELALADARSLPGAYRTERLLCLSRLLSELNLPPATDLMIRAEGEPFVLHPRRLDIPGLIARAITNRAELTVVSARSFQSKAVLRMKQQERYPWFSFLQAGRQFELGSRADSWDVRVGIELPISKWGDRNVQASEAEVERCRIDDESLRRRISLEIEQLAAQLRTRYIELEHYQQVIDPILRRDLALAEQAMITGGGDRLPYLTAQARQLQRRQGYLADVLECHRLEIELDRATGSLITQ